MIAHFMLCVPDMTTSPTSKIYLRRCSYSNFPLVQYQHSILGVSAVETQELSRYDSMLLGSGR
jgi:hypothetical protein